MKLLRKALEEIIDSSAPASAPEAAEQTILMRGPLAEVFTKALDVAYAKDNPEATPPSAEEVAAMESQQIDVALMQKLQAIMANGETPPTDNFQTVYGVARDAMTDEVIVDVAKEVVQHSAQQADNSEFVLVIDSTLPSTNGQSASVPTERLIQLETALECMVTAHGGKVFHSMKDYAASRVN